MMSKQERASESETEHEPPGSFSVGVRSIKNARSVLREGRGGAFEHTNEGGGEERRRYEYENPNPNRATENLTSSAQPSLTLFPELLRLI
jgi:hypothetical protein